jgi:hypothetical protein
MKSGPESGRAMLTSPRAERRCLRVSAETGAT